MTWHVRLSARIQDDMYVEADSEEEAIERAHADWSFVEASDWEAEVVSGPAEDDEDNE